MSRKKIVLTIISTIFIVLTFLSLKFFLKPDMVYVNRNLAFKKFKLTTVLLQENNILKKNLVRERNHIYAVLNKQNGNNVNPQNFNKLNEINKELEVLNSGLSPQNYEAIIKRFNVYVKEFAEKNGYDAILFYDDFEDVNYVSKKYDITDKFLVYANKRYEGYKG
jgi:hypothetical protein